MVRKLHKNIHTVSHSQGFSDANIMIDGDDISGVLDFGDSVER